MPTSPVIPKRPSQFFQVTTFDSYAALLTISFGLTIFMSFSPTVITFIHEHAAFHIQSSMGKSSDFDNDSIYAPFVILLPYRAWMAYKT
jgi:hypothetical protein